MVLLSKKNGDMITFNDREDSLREFLELKKKLGENISSIAKDVGIPERTLREFLGYEVEGVKKKRSLSSKNYNLIVNFFKKLSLRLHKQSFSNLVLLLENVTKNSIKWDFYSDFDDDEIDDFMRFREFICEDAQVQKLKGLSLLDLINPPVDKDDLPQDPFEKHANLSLAKKVFEKKFNTLKIWGSEYYKFLMRGDEKEVFIFISFDKDNQYRDIIEMSSKDGIFSPKQKEEPKF
tara:strand:+ start:2874 stop:3578 length:705 start_codon:yes stop_codon:yes gene_type:complete